MRYYEVDEIGSIKGTLNLLNKNNKKVTTMRTTKNTQKNPQFLHIILCLPNCGKQILKNSNSKTKLRNSSFWPKYIDRFDIKGKCVKERNNRIDHSIYNNDYCKNKGPMVYVK